MDLQGFLEDAFRSWSPPEPEVLKKTKFSITLDWSRVEPFQFIADQLLYRLEKNEKIPAWVVVYRGGKTSKEIDNLASRHCHKFRLRVIVKATAVPSLAERAVQFYGDEATVYEKVRVVQKKPEEKSTDDKRGGDASAVESTNTDSDKKVELYGEEQHTRQESRVLEVNDGRRKWLESAWSEPTWSSTDTDGTSAVCFCMAVRCGYIKQVQGMLDERPALIGIMNPSNGFTPLATAVRKGDINTVRFLLGAGAEIEQASSSGQTALHLAILSGSIPIVQLLLDQGADFQGRDLNGLRAEHYAVDSGSAAMLRYILERGGDVHAEDGHGWTPLFRACECCSHTAVLRAHCAVDSGSAAMLRYILERGGDVHAEDGHGWTPLFRALCQGASTELIEELVVRGSSLDMADRAGLPLTSVARLLHRQGRGRDSVLRLVDSSYPHEKALANFTRLTKKIYNVQSLLKLPSPRNK
ncbi:hypothetical protein PYW07_010309 [Mythimna separata]|uniref:Uncharacterized protein n=1 Tax=Mythimna separata TaxID=271217 RepID=A0AAD7YHR5_MYTSE|nr:hypothetical protein PYW07_010309 [Mythimna separata]